MKRNRRLRMWYALRETVRLMIKALIIIAGAWLFIAALFYSCKFAFTVWG